MPIERFYISQKLEGELRLVGTELHHLHVVRGKVGNEVELVNGRGSLAKARIVDLSRKEATLEVLETNNFPVPNPRLNLAIPLMRPSKLELVIEKCTELGAGRFYLYKAEYSEKKELSKHQKERLNLIAISAIKQCGRLDLPEIQDSHSLKELMNLDFPIFLGEPTSHSKVSFPEKILFVTGPEKGFSNQESKLLNSHGKHVTLSPYILRAETTPIAASCFFSSHT